MNLETIGQIISIVLGGGAVSTFWTWRADQLAQYRQLDDAYSQLLTVYRDNSELGDPASTVRYKTIFSGKQRLDYHYFAMSVHNVLETLFDVLEKQPASESNRQWASIFKHHARLHYAWLLDNTDAFESEYVDYVKELLGELPRATSTAPEIVHVAPLSPVTRTDVDVSRPTNPL
jgi:hypothetical protein